MSRANSVSPSRTRTHTRGSLCIASANNRTEVGLPRRGSRRISTTLTARPACSAACRSAAARRRQSAEHHTLGRPRPPDGEGSSRPQRGQGDMPPEYRPDVIAHSCANVPEVSGVPGLNRPMGGVKASRDACGRETESGGAGWPGGVDGGCHGIGGRALSGRPCRWLPRFPAAAALAQESAGSAGPARKNSAQTPPLAALA